MAQDSRPSEMPLLSERRVSITKEKKTDSFRNDILKKEKEEAQKTDMFSKMQKMAVTNEKWNPNNSMGGASAKERDMELGILNGSLCMYQIVGNGSLLMCQIGSFDRGRI